jgi:hypothetical protein
MNNVAKKIFKTLLLSATVALANHANAKADSVPSPLDLNLKDEDIDVNVGENKRKIIQGIYKIKRNGDVKLIAGHYSHRSHSSHRSSNGGHYSHSSSSTHYSSSSSHYSSSSGGYSGSSSSSSSSISKKKSTQNSKAPSAYSLGDRVMSNGIYGKDVDELVALLVKFCYLKEEGLTKKKAYYLYDYIIEKAVRHFQQDAGETVDGKLTVDQARKLSNWELYKTSITLGFRELSVSMSGYDVDALIKLLREAQFPPDPSKLEKENNHYVFTEDVMMAVKVFQAYHKLNPTGVLDSETVSRLNGKL